MAEVKLNRQERRVLEYILDNGSITSLQAQQELGVISLPKRISELRRKGIEIESKMVTVPNRYGERCRVCQYYLDEEEVAV